MGNPLINQGTLNRLRGSVLFDSTPGLNVTAPFLAEEGINIALEGEATTMIKSLTGTITSPEPFQMVTVTIHLNKAMFLADVWKAQQEIDTRIGDCVVRPDTTALSPYIFYNLGIQSVGALPINGKSVDYGVAIQGYWPINDTLWTEALG